MTVEEIEAIAGGYHGDAFRILGPHSVRKKGGQARWEVRAFLPQAESAEVVISGERPRWPAQHPEGFFCASLARRSAAVPHSRASARRPRNRNRRPVSLRAATLRFRPLPAYRGHAARSLAYAGRAHRRVRWSARACVSPCGRPMPIAVTVAGEFNDWDIRRHPMRWRNGGVWELFIPGLGEGAAYKYNVRSRFAGYQQLKADPYAFYCETPPKSASVVWNPGKYQWNDAAWMEARAEHDILKSPVFDLRGAPGILAARPARPDAHATATWRSSWWSTSSRWATPTSSCCPSWSTRSPARGATR